MATSLNNVLNENLRTNVIGSKVLVVGAGGIGCELIKNLVLTGFEDIELIDLDTIDVSNLNRQFLFRKEHVGKSKSQIARESALRFNKNAKIVSHHDSIMSSEYGTDYFKKFTMVLNALDNRAARNHVNRMCLAADVPLIESGTAGYLGQVTVIKKGLTECYECQPKPTQKTFPGCTIRNTPSEPIHCIVWAKHLFNQLFGEDDPDQDVSPDTEDPEAAGDAGQSALESSKEVTGSGEIERKSTRSWAQDGGYNGKKIFTKLFGDDIRYLLSMEKLWTKRRPPIPLNWDSLPDTASKSAGIEDQRIWTIKDCSKVFEKSLQKLRVQLEEQTGENPMLVWDKDDEPAMDFVTSAANIRAHIFNIPQKSKFDVKSMAGNIIPAIATTNAVIAGLIVMEALKILNGKIHECKQVYLNRQPNPRKKLLVPCMLDPPNPKCYVCAEKPEVTVQLNTKQITVKTLEEKILKGNLGMVAPDVEIDDGKGTILISSEEGETEGNADKFLTDFGIQNGSILKCDDFLQVYSLNINVLHAEKLEEDVEFRVIGDVSELQSKIEQEESKNKEEETQSKNDGADDEDDLVMITEEDEEQPAGVKRKASSGEEADNAKKRRTEEPSGNEISSSKDEDDIILL